MTKKFDNSINEVFGLFGKKQIQPSAKMSIPSASAQAQPNQQPQEPKRLADVLAQNVKYGMDRGVFDKDWGSKLLETIKLLQDSLR